MRNFHKFLCAVYLLGAILSLIVGVFLSTKIEGGLYLLFLASIVAYIFLGYVHWWLSKAVVGKKSEIFFGVLSSTTIILGGLSLVLGSLCKGESCLGVVPVYLIGSFLLIVSIFFGFFLRCRISKKVLVVSSLVLIFALLSTYFFLDKSIKDRNRTYSSISEVTTL